MTTLSTSANNETRQVERLSANRLIAIFMMCSALACLSCLDCAAKWLGQQSFPLIEILFVRYAVAFGLTALWLNPWRVPGAWHTPKLWLQTLRAVSLLGSTVCMVMAFRTMQLADTIAINFSLPLFIALLAGPILGEHIGLKQWLAIIAGFGGVLVIAQPGRAHFDPAVFFCFSAVGCNVFYQLATRRLSRQASTASMMLISTGLATAMLVPLVPSVWIMPQSPAEWIVMLVPGTFGALGHFLLVSAYSKAPAPVIAPFSYTQIAWSSLLGLIVFGDVPGFYTIIGAGIVILSGLYLIYLEARNARSVTDTPPVPAE